MRWRSSRSPRPGRSVSSVSSSTASHRLPSMPPHAAIGAPAGAADDFVRSIARALTSSVPVAPRRIALQAGDGAAPSLVDDVRAALCGAGFEPVGAPARTRSGSRGHARTPRRASSKCLAAPRPRHPAPSDRLRRRRRRDRAVHAAGGDSRAWRASASTGATRTRRGRDWPLSCWGAGRPLSRRVSPGRRGSRRRI